jgi:hypothetical protein
MIHRRFRFRLIGIVSILGLVLFLGSCRQFFTTSLAPWAARDPASLIPPVTTANIQDLLEQSANSPDQSLALLDKIKDALATASAEDQAVLQAAALSAASNASGVATSILSNAGDLLNAMESGQQSDIISVVSDAIAGLSNLASTATVLADILPAPGTPAFDDFVAQASPEDLAMAAIVLLAAEAQASGGVEHYITQFPPTSPNTTESLAVALAGAAAASYAASGGTGQLADILAGLHLTP